MKNAALFLICFLVGSAGIVILKWYDVNQFVVTACPVTLIIIYGIWAWSDRQDPHRAGDNLYYLGLLYTLVSLAVSLFEFTPTDENIESVTPIITNFGIAIFSTIFGIAGRVVFHQKQKTDSGERNLDRELDKAAVSTWTFGVRIEETNNKLTNLTDSVQEASKSFDESRQKLQAEFDDIYRKLQLAVTNFGHAVREADEIFNESRQALQDGSDAVLKSTTDLVTRINSVRLSEDFLERIMMPPIQQGAVQIGIAGESLANRLNNVQIPSDVLERTFQQAVERFLVEMDRYLRVHFDNASHDLKESLTEYSQVAKTANKDLVVGGREMRDGTSTFAASIRDLSRKINDIEVAVDLPERVLRSSIEPIENFTSQMGTAGDKLVQMLEAARGAAVDLEHGIRKTATAFSEPPPKKPGFLRRLLGRK